MAKAAKFRAAHGKATIMGTRNVGVKADEVAYLHVEKANWVNVLIGAAPPGSESVDMMDLDGCSGPAAGRGEEGGGGVESGEFVGAGKPVG